MGSQCEQGEGSPWADGVVLWTPAQQLTAGPVWELNERKMAVKEGPKENLQGRFMWEQGKEGVFGTN